MEANWYLIHTKPRQEKRAQENLENQGYVCYLPFLPTEKIVQGKMQLFQEPLFPRYLFISLSQDESAKSWGPIRSTMGVSRLVCFGNSPAKVDEELIRSLKAYEQAAQNKPTRLFEPGEKVLISEGAFSGVEGIFHMPDGESRAMVLIELLSKPVVIGVGLRHLHKSKH